MGSDSARHARRSASWRARDVAATAVFILLAVQPPVHAAESKSGPIIPPSPDDLALARRAMAAAESARGTPGQEFVNYITANWPRDAVRTLQGEKPGTLKDYAAARTVITELAALLEAAPAWPRPRMLSVPKTPAPPAIDGRINEPAWRKAARFEGMYSFNQTNLLMSPVTTWRLLWDATHLYFAFECEDQDIAAPNLPRDGLVFFHDCVEVFLLPDFRLGLYWEIVAGPTGCVYDGLNSKRFDAWGGVTRKEENIEGLQVGCVIDGTADDTGDTDRGYAVELAVPFREIPTYTRGNPPRAGDILHVMLVRIDQNGESMTPYAFQPLLAWGHNIWNHYAIRLEELPPAP